MPQCPSVSLNSLLRRDDSRPPSPRRGFPTGAALAAVFLLSALLGWREMFSPDMGTHLGSGRWIVEHRAWPRLDPFVYAAGERPYVDLYWLYQVALWILYVGGGTAAVVAAHIALTLAAFGLLVRRSAVREGGVSPWCAPVLLLVALGNTWECRPHAVSWVLLAALLLAIEETRRGRDRLWLLPTIMAVWVNCHPMFVLGLGVIVVHVAAAMRREPGARRRWIAWGAAGLAACLLNPYGVSGLLFPFRQIARFGHASPLMAAGTGIAELMSPLTLGPYTANRALVLFQPLLFMQVAAVAAIVAMASRRARRPVEDALLAVLFGAMFLGAQKAFGYFAVAAFPAIVGGWDALARRAASGTRSRGALVHAVASAALILFCGLVAAWIRSGYLYAQERVPHRFGHRFNPDILPVRACEFLNRSVPEGRVLNSFGSGGTVAFLTRRRVFIDGRTDIAGEDFYAEYLRLLNPALLPAGVRRWKPDIVLVTAGDEPAWLAFFSRDPLWRCVYADERDLVFLRRGFAPEVQPVTPLQPRRDYPVFSAAEIDAALEGAPGRSPSLSATLVGPHVYPLRELRQSGLYLFLGHAEVALGCGIAGLRRGTVPAPDVLNNVMQAFLSLGDYERAWRCCGKLPAEYRDPQLEARLREAVRR